MKTQYKNASDLRNIRQIKIKAGDFAVDIPVTLEVGVYGGGRLFVRPDPLDQPDESLPYVQMTYLMRGIDPTTGNGFEDMSEYPPEITDRVAQLYDVVR